MTQKFVAECMAKRTGKKSDWQEQMEIKKKLEQEGIFFIAYADDIVIATLGTRQIRKAIKIT